MIILEILVLLFILSVILWLFGLSWEIVVGCWCWMAAWIVAGIFIGGGIWIFNWMIGGYHGL